MSENVFSSYILQHFFIALLKGLLIYIRGLHILPCHYSLLTLEDVPDYTLQRKSLCLHSLSSEFNTSSSNWSLLSSVVSFDRKCSILSEIPVSYFYSIPDFQSLHSKPCAMVLFLLPGNSTKCRTVRPRNTVKQIIKAFVFPCLGLCNYFCLNGSATVC